MAPQGFTAIQDAITAGDTVSLLGVVISFKEATKTKGTDWVLDFTLQDDFSDGAIGGGSSMTCRVFSTPHTMPKITNTGDLVILRNFKLNAWRGRIDCVNADKSQAGVIVFPASKLPSTEPDPGATQQRSRALQFDATRGTRPPSTQEQMAILDLSKAASALMPQVKANAVVTSFKGSNTKDKLSLIKDIAYNRFYDLKVEVVNIYYSTFGTVELKVTDYTSNAELFLYVDPDEEDDDIFTKKNWAGPYGQLTLDVRLYGNNCEWARNNVHKGDYVFLRNMRTKMSPANKLEGALHEDKENIDQVDIRQLIDSDDINEIAKRREAYEEKRANKWPLKNAPKKSSAKASAKRKEEKKQRQREAKEQELKELEKKAEEKAAARSGINVNIVAGYPDLKLSTISEIVHNPCLTTKTAKNNTVTLPFINCRYRTRVRIVDFFPPKLELFSRSVDDPKWNESLGSRTDSSIYKRMRWEWSFALLLEDASAPAGSESERLRVVVGDSEGQHILKTNAVDLSDDSCTLKKLEEKLFLLWGNCFELKKELRAGGSDLPLASGDPRLQNRPFECCIEEYGLEGPITKHNPTGYKRMHKPFATTIMD